MSVRTITTTIIAIALAGSTVAGQATSVGATQLPSPYYDQQHGISLDEAIAQAIAREPTLRAERADVEVARGMREQAGLRPNPSMSFEWREEPAGTDNQMMLSVQWPLDLFRKDGRTNVADRQFNAAELSALDRERLLAADVRLRYGDVLAGIRDLGLLDELVDAVRRQLELLRSRVQVGSSPPLERDLIQVDLQQLESSRLLQSGRVDAAVFALKRGLGEDSTAPLAVRETLEEVVRREAGSAVNAADAESAGEQRADVRGAAARIAVAEAKADRAERDSRMDVSLFGSYTRMDAGFPQFGVSAAGSPERIRGVFHYAAAGAMLTIPVLNRNQGEIAAARAERAGAEAAHEAARLTARTEIAAARALDQRSHEAVSVYGGDAQALARQNLAVVAESYALGRVTVFDVLAEQRRFLDVERAYTDALRAAFEARTVLVRALGVVR